MVGVLLQTPKLGTASDIWHSQFANPAKGINWNPTMHSCYGNKPSILH
jgi:hypothetical protein